MEKTLCLKGADTLSFLRLLSWCFQELNGKKKENFKETCSPPLELIHSSDLSGRGHGRVIVYGRVHGYALHHDKSGVTVEI